MMPKRLRIETGWSGATTKDIWSAAVDKVVTWAQSDLACPRIGAWDLRSRILGYWLDHGEAVGYHKYQVHQPPDTLLLQH